MSSVLDICIMSCYSFGIEDPREIYVPVLVLVHYTPDIYYWRLVSQGGASAWCSPPTGIRSTRIQDKMRSWDIEVGSRPLIPFSDSSWPIRDQRGGLGIRCESTWDRRKEEPPSSEEGNINGKSEIQLNQIKMIVLDIPGYAVRTHHTAKLMGRYQFQTNKRFSITIPNIWMHSLFIMTRSIVQNSD